MMVIMRQLPWMRFCALILAVLGLLSVATDAAGNAIATQSLTPTDDTSVSPSSTTSSTRSRSSSRRSMTWLTDSRTSNGTNTNSASITLTDSTQMSATNSVSTSSTGMQTKTAGSVTRSSSKLDGSITATGNSRSTTRVKSVSATTSDSMTASLSAPKCTSTPTRSQTRSVSSTTSLSKSLLSLPSSKTFTMSTTSSISRSITLRVPPTTTKTRSNSRSMAQSVTNSPSRDPMSHSWSLSSSNTLSNSSVLTNTLHSLSMTVSPTVDDSITASHTDTDPRTTSHTESTSMLASSLTESASASQSPSLSMSESTMFSKSVITLTTSTTLTVTTKTVTVSVSLTHFITKPPTPTTTQVLSESKASSSLSTTGTASVSASVTYSMTVSASLNLTSDTSSVSSSVTTTLSATKATPSLSVSRFMSASRTPTNSRKTSSRSSSSARSSTRSVSQSVTSSASVSTTTTTTLSFSQSPSHNATSSATITPPPTPSRSITLRLTPSATFSNNISVSASVSFSQTFTHSASSFLSQSRSTSAVDSRSTTGSTTVTVPSRSRSGHTRSPTYTRSTTRDHTQTPTASKSWSASRSLSLSRTASPSSSTTLTTSDTVSLTKSMSADSTTTLTIYFSVTHNPTPTASPSITLSHEHSRSGSSSVSISQTVSSTITSSLSGGTVSNEATATASTSSSTSSTASASSTPTETDSPSITVDPCNTTFRANSTDFIDSIQVAGNVLAFSPVYLDGQYILKMNRVQFTLLDSIQVDVNFNTYLRNFYYEVGQQWFVQPNVQGCRVMSAEPLNATSLRYRVQYDPDVVLRLSVHDNLVCNVTFSTDIFQCHLMTNLTFNFSLAILATSMDPWISDSALQAVNSITTILTTVMGAVSMLAQSRAAALMALSTCQFSIVDPIDFPDNIFELAIGTLENRYYRGTVIGNLAFIGAVTLLGIIAVSIHFVIQRRKKRVTELEQPPPPAVRSEHDDDEDGGVESVATSSRHSREPPPVETNHDGVVHEGDMFGNDLDDDDGFDLVEVISPINDLGRHRRVSDILLSFPATATRKSEIAVRHIKKAVRRTTARVSVHLWEWSESAAALRFPSILLVPIAIIYDNTVTASVSLIAHPREPYDSELGVFGIVVCALVLVAVAVAVAMRRKLRLVRTHAHHAYPIFQRNRWMRYLFYPRAHWSARKPKGSSTSTDATTLSTQDDGGRSFKSAVHFLYDDVSVPLCALMEFLASFIVGVCLGIGLSERRVCLALSFVCLIPLLVICVMLIRLRPILTRSGFFCVTATNILALLSSIFIVAGMLGSTDALGNVPSIVAFTGVICTLLRAVADYTVLGLWIRYNACDGRQEQREEQVEGAELSVTSRRERALKRLRKLRKVSAAFIAGSSSDESDESYDSSASNDSLVREMAASTSLAGPQLVVHTTLDDNFDMSLDEGSHYNIQLGELALPMNPGGGLTSRSASFSSSQHERRRGDSIVHPPVSLAHEIDLVFGSSSDSDSGGSTSPPVASFGSADILRSIDLSRQRDEQQSALRTRAASNIRTTVQPSAFASTQGSSLPHRELTADEYDDLARHAELRAQITSLRPYAPSASQASVTKKGKSTKVRNQRSMSLAAPPTDVLRRLGAPPYEGVEENGNDSFVLFSDGDPFDLLHSPVDEFPLDNLLRETTPPPPSPPRQTSGSSADFEDIFRLH